MWNNLEETTFADNDYFLVLFSKKITFLLKKKTTFLERLLQLRKNYVINRDSIRNVEDLPRLVLIDEDEEPSRFTSL